MVKLKIAFVLFILVVGYSSQAEGTQKRKAKDLNSKNADSLNTHINKKLDSLTVVNKQVDSILRKDNLNGKDSMNLTNLVNKRNQLIEDIHVFTDISTESNDDTQSNTLSLGILGFGFLLMCLVIIFQYVKDKQLNPLVFKLIGIMFIGTVSVFLVPAGFDNNQITPVVGLLGTLAGYLIGSSPQHRDNRSQSGNEN